MNKTVFFKRTLSNAANVSSSEEQLDAAIFYCLNALSKRYSPSDQFRAVFVKGMFLKPNTKAFIHVLHFLFNIYDAKEFRKRFYWPIFDKNAESAFRSSTVEYVNSLVDRGKLEMEKIKAHTVVLPGGAKFMKFLLVLIKFVLSEDLRKAGGGTGAKVITKGDVEKVVAHHQEWEDIGTKMRQIVQKDLEIIQSRIQTIDERLEELFANSQGPATLMSTEKLMQLWGTINRKHFEESEDKQRKIKKIAEEYDKVIVSARRKLEPREIKLGINEDDLKQTLYQLEVLYADNADIFRQVFDENGKIDAVKLFEILVFLLPKVDKYLTSFSVRSTESLKFELKELSKVAVKSDNICNELACLRRSLPFLDMKFQELTNHDKTGDLINDFGIRNKIFNTPPITINFQEDAEIGTVKRNRIALFDDDHIHNMNLRMRVLATSTCPTVPRTPRSAKKPKVIQQSPGNVFAVPRPARKEKMNPLSMLKKITAQGETKSKLAQPANSTMNISSLSSLGDISLRPEFSSTLLGTPEKVTHNRRSINANETLTVESTPVPSTPSLPSQSSSRYKTIYSEAQEPTTIKSVMSPDALFLFNQSTKGGRRRSSLLQLDQLQTSPSGKLDPLVAKSLVRTSTRINGAIGEFGEVPRIRISPLNELDSGICEDNRTKGDLSVIDPEGTTQEQNTTESLELEEKQSSLDLSTTLVALNLSKLTLNGGVSDDDTTDTIKPAAVPAETLDEDLFNVSDGILTDFD
ncbi:augmin complex subunit dgt6 [Toxorhynchites rutilus septentrionalis]|uniref:augmin complex subunit dgt6 n=1 Tax=Toxorhynchites rutilus septentrionalis TaxID=329112 RepID=UPI002479A34C|nr:augmin complex subunit dgt6 [Toxorhynchites rutilus septentrionalis]